MCVGYASCAHGMWRERRVLGDNLMVLSPPQIAEKLIKVFAEQIFYTGFIHSDPHPGNGKKSPQGVEVGLGLEWVSMSQCALPLVLVRKGPDGKAELVLLDHGLYQFLDEK